jgi:enoyl-CoA hydratase
LGSSSIRIEQAGEVAVLRIGHGKANTLDSELCREIVARLTEAEESGARAVVLTGAGDIFSAGVDLRRISEGGTDYIRDFLLVLSDAFLSVFGFPGPVVAALNGHAIAGGAVLAAACDLRVLNSARGRIGVTELLVGVPFPLVALEILRCAYGDRRLPELTFRGHTHAGEAALGLGLADELAEPDAVLARSVELAGELARIPRESFLHTKAQIHRPFDERIGEQRAVDDARVERLWTAPEARAAIEEYVQRVLVSR